MNNAIDNALEAIRHANPVPDPVDLADAMLRSDVFLTATKEISMNIDTDQPTPETPAQRQSAKRRNVLALVGAFAAAVVVIGGVAVLLASGDGDDSFPATAASATVAPGDVINDYVAAYNSGDIDAVMDMFTEDSVIYGHPAHGPFSSETAGLTQLRSLHMEDLAAGASTDAYSISNVEVNGDTVRWDHVWVNKQGETYCQTGQSAVIKDGKILTWTWPLEDSACR